MFYVGFENSTTVVLQHVFQYGIIQEKASQDMLGCLKCVMPKKTQAEWGKALS